MAVPGSDNAPKSEPKRQDFDSCFENNLEFCGNYLKQRYPGSVPSFPSVQLPPLPSFPFSHMITRRHTCQDLIFPFHMGINSSSYAAMSSYELGQASSNVTAYQYLGVPLPNVVEHMSAAGLMKKEMHTHGSPDSPLSSRVEFSPPPYE